MTKIKIMTNEQKQLLLKDLSARLPYGIICHTENGDGYLCSINQTIFGNDYGLNINPLYRDYFNDSETDEASEKYTKNLSPEQEAYIASEKFQQAEKEKDEFTTRRFLRCLASFDKFREGGYYWLEYVGGDTYVGRSDNVLGEKFHITPRQLFTLFSPQLDEAQEPPKKEGQVSSECETPMFEETPSDEQIVGALIHYLSEQDGFLTAINCVSTKAILGWLKKQKEQNPIPVLLKDLSARLPYGVIYHRKDGANIELRKVDIKKGNLNYTDNIVERECKPYLRPMSSMTKEERIEREKFIKCIIDEKNHYRHYVVFPHDSVDYHDWLNAHHFDYRGLIEKGLALEAPKGMYNKEESEKGSEIPTPKTVDEAISTLEKILSDEDREYLLENGAISMHDSLGRWIRNEWGLWTGSELKNELKKKGFEHPDDMSNYIIEEFIKYWNNKV